MAVNRQPLIKLLLILLLIAGVFYMPTREFLKITFILGIPFIFTLGFMVRQSRYSSGWIISLMLLIAIVGGYGYMLTNLPDRIETRRIISEAGALVAEGKYDQAIELYKQLEALGKTEQMQEKIELAQLEQQAAIDLNQARILIEQGKESEAIKLLKQIPKNTRSGYEANKLLRRLQ